MFQDTSQNGYILLSVLFLLLIVLLRRKQKYSVGVTSLCGRAESRNSLGSETSTHKWEKIAGRVSIYWI